MNQDNKPISCMTSKADTGFSVFITNYLASLRERTRSEKGGIVFGFDWVVYNLGITLGWQAVRLPFLRDPSRDAAKTKTETEFGVDMSFVTTGGEELRIFVLKDEPLTNGTWTRNDFDADLRRAACPDLAVENLKSIKRVVVTLAYNKDEDAGGLILYNRCIANLEGRIGNNAELVFERWNLTKIVSLVESHLLSPQLLPQNLSGLFAYICSQFADFEYGTEAWDRQLVPNWKRFLDEVGKGRMAESVIRLVPVALVILDKHRRDQTYSRIGWLDLVEWAMLKLWALFPCLDEIGKESVTRTWVDLYLRQLEVYLNDAAPSLACEHGIHTCKSGFMLDALNDACSAYWHLERVGLHALSILEMCGKDDEQINDVGARCVRNAGELIGLCLHANPASLRPLIDLHHISLYLMWWVLQAAGRVSDIEYLLTALESRLAVRRWGNTEIPFVEGGNRLALVAETVALGKKPSEFIDSSSYMLLMLMELAFSLGETTRDDLLKLYAGRLIAGVGSDGERLSSATPIQIVDWMPPNDWGRRVLGESVRDGVGISLPRFCHPADKRVISSEIMNHVAEVRHKFPWALECDGPGSVLILACIKNLCPLPSYFWRAILFPEQEDVHGIDLKP